MTMANDRENRTRTFTLDQFAAAEFKRGLFEFPDGSRLATFRISMRHALTLDDLLGSQSALFAAMAVAALVMFGMSSTVIMISVLAFAIFSILFGISRHALSSRLLVSEEYLEFRRWRFFPVVRVHGRELESIMITGAEPPDLFLRHGTSCATADIPRLIIATTDSILRLGGGVSPILLRMMATHLKTWSDEFQRYSDRGASEVRLFDLYADWMQRLGVSGASKATEYVADASYCRIDRASALTIARSLEDTFLAAAALTAFALTAALGFRGWPNLVPVVVAFLSLSGVAAFALMLKALFHVYAGSVKWTLGASTGEITIHRDFRAEKTFATCDAGSIVYIVPSRGVLFGVPCETIFGISVYLTSGRRIRIDLLDESNALQAATFLAGLASVEPDQSGAPIVGHAGPRGGSDPPVQE